MRFLAAVIAVPALLIGWQLWSDHSFEQRLEPIAAGISGRPDTVNCQSFWGGLIDAQAREGEVFFNAAGVPESKLFLTRPTCQRLRKFAGHSHHGELDCLAAIDWTAAEPLPFDSECYARARRTIYAVLILAHESYHTAGVADEAAANCFAIQAMAWTACNWERPPARPSCSPARWRRSSRDRAASTGRPSVTPAGSSISTRRPPRSRPSTRSCRRSATAACRRSSAG